MNRDSMTGLVSFSSEMELEYMKALLKRVNLTATDGISIIVKATMRDSGRIMRDMVSENSHTSTVKNMKASLSIACDKVMVK